MSKDHFYFSRNDRVVALVLLTVIIISVVIRMPRHGAVADTETRTDSAVKVSERETSWGHDSVVKCEPADSIRSVSRRSYSSRTAVRSSSGKDIQKSRTDYKKDTVRNYHYENGNYGSRRYPTKVRPLSPLDLNALDSSALVQLPGIGPVFASRIIRYREQLGGFASTLQLTEIKGLPDSLMKWFVITDTVPVRMIEVNRESLNELRRHPYINFYQARAIVELRRERGNIKGPEQLSLLEEFSVQDLERLKPYLDFR